MARHGTGAPQRTASATTSWRPVALAVLVLAVSNFATNRLLPDWAYVPWGIGIVVVLLAIAAWDRCGPDELGLGRATWGSGFRLGGAVFAAVLAGYLIALAIPATREFFDDARVRDAGTGEFLYQVIVRIPVGTVLVEELAFRGVLLALLMRRTTVRWAVLASSALFGLWHVLPAIGIEEANPLLADWLGAGIGPVLAVVGAVLGTTAAGLVFCWLRLRSASLLAPVLLHVATNSLGFAVSWVYLHLR